MRISTLQVFNRGVNDLLNATEDVTRTQNQISTGRRIITPADDPVASAKILKLNQESALIEQYMDNINSTEARLSIEETQLDAVGKIVSRMREVAIIAGNGSFSQEDRKVLASEMEERLGELVNILNARDASGQYLFGGYKSEEPPFVDVGDSHYVYVGDEGQRELSIANGSTIAVGDNGKDLFVDIPSAHNTFYTFASSGNSAAPPAAISVGEITNQTTYDAFFPEDIVVTFNDPPTTFNVTRKSDGRVINSMTLETYVPGQDITVEGVTFNITGSPASDDKFTIKSSSKQSLLATAQKLMSGLDSLTDSTADKAKLDELLTKSLGNFSNAETRLLEVRSRVGHRLNTLDSTRSLHEELSISNEKILSEIQDLDYTEAITALNLQSIVLQAAQQSFTKISELTLFNFIR